MAPPCQKLEIHLLGPLIDDAVVAKRADDLISSAHFGRRAWTIVTCRMPKPVVG
jgi:hypothetical protein